MDILIFVGIVIAGIVVIAGGIKMFGSKKQEEVSGVMTVIGENEAFFHIPFKAEDMSVGFVDIEPPPSGCNPSPNDTVEIETHHHGRHVRVSWAVGEPRKIKWTASR